MQLDFDASFLAAYVQIIVINVVLSGDNIIVIGMAAASLPQHLRSKAIAAGIVAATIIRIVFAVVTVQILAFAGLLLAGGLLLTWVCWKLFLELRVQPGQHGSEVPDNGEAGKGLAAAIVQIIVADVSMSLDNVLAVAGAAKQNLSALVFGLILSVILMGFAASLIARLLARFRSLGWIGLAIIAYVALSMIYQGTEQLLGHTLPAIPFLKD